MSSKQSKVDIVAKKFFLLVNSILEAKDEKKWSAFLNNCEKLVQNKIKENQWYDEVTKLFKQFKPLLKALAAIKKMSAEKQFAGLTNTIAASAVELSKGIILSPSSTETKTLEKYIWKSHIEKSTDNGENWTKIPIDHNSEFNVIQPTILVHSKDTIQVLNRSRENKIISSFSYDSGESWTDLKPLELNNPNSGVDGVTLKNGTHLLVYNPNINGRSKLVLSESDDGINWTDKLILEDEETGEFSYPAIIEASDGLIHISYTFNRRNIKHVVIEVN